MIVSSQKSEVANSSLLIVNSKNNSLSHQPSTISHQLLNLLPIIRHLSLFLYCLLFITACGHTPPKLSDAHLRAVEFNQKAESAFKKGNYKNALDFYDKALKINRSIENIDGIAINLINMAAVYYRLNDKDNALRYIDEALKPLDLEVRNKLLSEAMFLKSLLYLEDGDYEKAVQYADLSLSSCQKESCLEEGKIYNLKGRIALLKEDSASAVTLGMEGLKLNEAHDDKLEMANSLRLTAEAKTKNREYEEAKRLYEEAMLIDKSIGLSKKIAMDLMGIGNLFFRQELFEKALSYYQRALSVSKEAGYEQGLKDAIQMIEKCSLTLNKK